MAASDVGNWSVLVWIHIWQIGLLGVVVGIINWFVARRWPHLAYALWLVVLVKCFVPPIGNWPLNVLGQLAPPSIMETTKAGGRDESARPTQRFDPDASQVEPAGNAPRLIQRATSMRARGLRSTQALTSWAHIAAPVIWLIGSALLCGIAIGRGNGIGRRLRRSSQPLPASVQSTANRLAARLRLRRGANVLSTTMDVGPVVVGIWSPTIFIPKLLIQRSQPRQLEAMLAHEFAHVRRRDTWVAALQFVAQTIWWFHPIVWWMNRELVRQRERCCDEEAVANLDGRRSDYARCLIDVLEARKQLEPMWGYPAVRPVELTRRRLEEIMTRKNMTHTHAPYWCWGIGILFAVLVLPSAGPSAAADADEVSNDAGLTPLAETSAVAPTEKEKSTAAAPGERTPLLLKYGDGKADGKKSYGGSGQLIRFQMPQGIDKARGLRIHGSRYGYPQAPDEDFEITFLNEDLSETLDTRAAPYRLFKRGKESWVRVLFEEEVELPPVFWVSLNFNAHQTKGVYVSYDTSTKGEHSRVGLPGDEEEPKETDFRGEWMVQVMLSRPSQ